MKTDYVTKTIAHFRFFGVSMKLSCSNNIKEIEIEDHFTGGKLFKNAVTENVYTNVTETHDIGCQGLSTVSAVFPSFHTNHVRPNEHFR